MQHRDKEVQCEKGKGMGEGKEELIQHAPVSAEGISPSAMQLLIETYRDQCQFGMTAML